MIGIKPFATNAPPGNANIFPRPSIQTPRRISQAVNFALLPYTVTAALGFEALQAGAAVIDGVNKLRHSLAAPYWPHSPT